MRFRPISVTSLWTLVTTLESYDSDKILTLSFKSFGIHICGQHMHSFLSSMGRVVHFCFQSSSIPGKKIMVKFGFFEVQSGFKSCIGYLCKRKRKRKRKRNVNKIHQISLENNLIVHKINGVYYPCFLPFVINPIYNPMEKNYGKTRVV